MDKTEWLQYTKEERCARLAETLEGLNQQQLPLPGNAPEKEKMNRQKAIRKLEKEIFIIIEWEKEQNE